MSDNNTIKRRSGYSSVPNAAMSDERLGIDTRGLLAMLMTMKSGWKFRRNDLLNRCGCARGKYDKMIGELKQFGYLIIAKVQAKNGQFTGYEWQIIDAPQPTEGRKNRPSEKRAAVKPDHIRETNSKVKKDIAKAIPKKTDLPNRIFNAWNDMASRNGLAKVNINILHVGRCRKVIDRLASCKGDEQLLFDAIENVPKDPFLLGHGNRGWRANFDWVFKPDNFHKVLEFEYHPPNETQNAKSNIYHPKSEIERMQDFIATSGI